MSLKSIEDEIRRFLAAYDREVICIRGKWGVGKTFVWNKYLLEAKKQKGGIALGSYAYVMLFGINSLDNLKYAVFENSVDSKGIGIEPSVETVKKSVLPVRLPESLRRFW